MIAVPLEKAAVRWKSGGRHNTIANQLSASEERVLDVTDLEQKGQCRPGEIIHLTLSRCGPYTLKKTTSISFETI